MSAGRWSVTRERCGKIGMWLLAHSSGWLDLLRVELRGEFLGFLKSDLPST